MEEIRTWHLADVDVQDAVAKLGRLNARAEKNGLAGRYAWTLSEEIDEPVYDDGVRVEERRNGVPYDAEGRPVPVLYYRVMRDLHVSGEAPKLAGWTFVARLTWDEGALVTRCTPGFEGRIDDSLIRVRECDHCHQDRARNDCYLLENEQGERVQVGSSCVKDFLGHDFKPSYITYGSDLDEMEEGFCGRATEISPAINVLSWAASICSGTGWVSQQKAELNGGAPSGALLKECLFGNGKVARQLRDKYAPTDAHHEEAAKVLAWAQDIDPGNPSEYMANVRRVAQANQAGERNAAILGSAVASYHREIARQLEREARPVSKHIGKPKERLILDLTVKGETVIDGYYGATHLFTMTDAAGNVFKWFSSNGQGWETGQAVKIKGTVKGHEIYNEVAQTVLTRCSEMPGEAQKEAC
jgi:hypothetical protein